MINLSSSWQPGGLFTKGRKQQSHVRWSQTAFATSRTIHETNRTCDNRKPFAINIARAIRLIHETRRKISVQSHVRLSMRRRIFIHLRC